MPNSSPGREPQHFALPEIGTEPSPFDTAPSAPLPPLPPVRVDPDGVPVPPDEPAPLKVKTKKKAAN